MKVVTGNLSNATDYTALSGTGRYVRVIGTARATTNGYGINELEVYGHSSVSSPRQGLFQKIDNLEFKLYPNPADLSVTLELPEHKGSLAKVTVTDILGNVMMEGEHHIVEHTDVVRLDLGHLVSGVYFIHVISPGKDLIVEKLIVE
jgi:hypothetical protein